MVAEIKKLLQPQESSFAMLFTTFTATVKMSAYLHITEKKKKIIITIYKHNLHSKQ